MSEMRKIREQVAEREQRARSPEDDLPVPLRPSESRRHRLRQLRAFCHVARLGSISKAAKRVYSSQPAVSVQIRALEEELAVSLVERNGPNITLTSAGRDFYRLALPLVEDIDRLPDTFAEQYHRVVVDIHVAAGETAATVLLPRYLKKFSERHPDTRVYVRTGTGRDCLEWLRSFEVDLVIAAMDVEPPDLRHYPILAANQVIITPEDHPLAGSESATLQDLGAYPVVRHTVGTHLRQFGEILLQQHRIPVRVGAEIDGWGRHQGLCRSGFRDRGCPRPLSRGRGPAVSDSARCAYPSANLRSDHPP